MSQPNSHAAGPENQIPFYVKVLSVFTLLVLSIAGGLLVPGLFKLRTSYDVEQFFPMNDESYKQSVAISNKYGIQNNPAIVALLSNKDGSSWSELENARKAKQATETLKTVPNVVRVLSYANRAGAQVTNNSIQVGNLIDVTDPREWPQRFQNDALMSPLFLSKDLKTALVFIEIQPLEVSEIKPMLEKIRNQLEFDLPEATVRLGGVPTLQSDFQVLLESEIFRFVAYSFAATFFVIILLFATWSTWLQTLVFVCMGNIAALSFISWMGWSLTVLSITTPILVTVITVSQAIHTFFRIHERKKTNHGWTGLLATHRELIVPNFLSGLTASVGFLTLFPSEIPMISNFGMTVGASIMISWVVTTITMIPFSFITELAEPRAWTLMRARWVLKLLQYRKQVLLGVTASVAVSLIGLFTLNWNGRLYDDVPEHQSSRQVTELIDSKMGGSIPLDVEITTSADQSWSDPERMGKFDALAKEFRTWPGIGNAIGYSDFLKAFGDGSGLPTTRGAISEMIFMYSMNDVNPLKNFISNDERSVRLMIKLQDLPGSEMIAMADKIKARAQEVFTTDTIITAGMGKHLHPINNRVSKNMIFDFWHALVGITLVLMVILRSARWAIVSAIPNFVPPAFLLAGMALTQTPIKPPLALIFSISLGLAFNNTVYLMMRLKDYVKKGKKYRLVEEVFRSEGVTCLHSTIVIASGFTVFLFASFSMNKIFGAFMLLSIAAGIVGDLIFLPCLIKWKPGLLGLKPIAPMIVRGPTAANNKSKDDQTPETSAEVSTEEGEDMIPRAAAALALVFLVGGASEVRAASDPALKARFEKALKQFDSKDEEAKVRLSIIEADGSKKSREIMITRVGGKNEQRVMARIVAPTDLKGTGFLSIMTKDAENQWVYLPSSKQTRKVVTGEQKEGGVLGSELRYEDFNPSVVRETEVKLVKTEELAGKSYDIIEYKIPAGVSPYQQAQVWIEKGTETPYQIDYFVGTDKVKTINFQNYKKIGTVFRPSKMTIKNLKNNRGTEIELTAVKVNRGLSLQSLSPESLAKTW